MAFEINDLKGIFILVLFAIPMVASTNINCSGRAFHCVNSTHFMICVDLGGGISSTIDDFVIPCPATTVCHENNIFECDFPEVTTPPLQVIGVNKQSDPSEPTSVTSSVNTPTPTSDIFSVFKENITATTLPIAEDVTPVVKLEVLENIMNIVGVYSDNTTETSVTFSFSDSTNDFVNDKQTSNYTIMTSATDNNKHLEPAVVTSINEFVNTSSTDKSTSTDTVTSVIGLINLISTDPPSVMSTKPSSNVFSSNNNIATTTEQYSTKEVTTYGKKLENVTDKLNIPTEKSVITDKVSTTLMLDTLITKDINHQIENKNQTSGHQTIAEQNSFGKGNITKIVPETTTEYVYISEPITVNLSPLTTTDNTLVPLGLADLISAKPKQNKTSTSDYIDNFYGDTTTSTPNEFNTKLETTSSENPVIAEIISTAPVANTVLQNVLKNYSNNNSTSEIVTVENVRETNTNSFILEPTTVASMQTSTKKTFVSITTEATTVYAAETNAISEALFNNDSPIEKQTIVNQPLEVIITTDSPRVVTDNVYQINGDLNQTLISRKNISDDTTERINTVYNAPGIEINNNKITEPVLLLPPSTKHQAIEITIAETLQNGFTAPAIEIANESPAVNIFSSANEPLMKNVEGETLLYNTTNTMNITETVKRTVFNASSLDIMNGKEPTTIKYATIEVSTDETTHNEFTVHAIEVKTKLQQTTGSINVNESNSENVESDALLSIYTSPAPYNLTSVPVTKTSVKDLISQSDIVKNPLKEFITEIISRNSSEGHTFIDQATTQKSATDPQDGNHGYISATSLIKSQDDIPKIIRYSIPPSNYNVTEHSSTAPEMMQTALSLDSMQILEQVSTNTQKTTPHPQHQELLNHENNTVNQINTTTTEPKTVSNVSPTLTNAGDVLDTKNIDSVNPETIISKYDSNIDINKTETLNPINGKDSVDATYLASPKKTNKSESIKKVSVLDIVNSSGNAMPIEKLQPTSSNPSLSNDYIKTSESQTSSAYVTTTDKVPDYNSVYVEELVTQKYPDVIVSFADTKVMNSILSTPSMHSFSETEIKREKVQYVNTETSTLGNVDFQHINPTTTAADYVTEKTNDYFPTEKILSQQNKLSKVQAETLAGSVSSVPGTAVTPTGFTIIPVNYDVTTIIDHAFIMSSTQMTSKVVTDIKTSTEPPRSTSKVVKQQIVKYNTESLLPISKLPVAQITTEPTHTTKVFDQTTPLDNTNQNVQLKVKTTDFPQYVLSTVNKNIPQPISLPAIVKVKAAQRTSEPTQTTIFTQTTLLPATSETSQSVLGIQTTDLPQYVTSTVKQNITQSMPSLPTLKATASQRTTQSTQTTIFARITPLDTTNQNVIPVIKTTVLPKNMTSIVNKSIPQSISSLPIVQVTSDQITTAPTHTTTTKTNQDIILPGIEKTDLPQYVTTTVTYNNSQSITDITTETIIDSLTVPDAMVETIKVVGYKVSGTHLGETILNDVMSTTTTFNNADDIKSVKNIIDHESIVVGATSKDYEQNTPLTSGKPADINSKAEIVNHTEINWMTSDVNIESVKVKESSIEEEDLKSSVLKSDADVKNNTLVLDSETLFTIQPKAVKSANKIEYKFTTAATNYKQAETGDLNNVTQSNTLITKENKNAETDSSVNANIEIIDVKKYQVQVDSNKNISDSSSINNTKANITPHHNLLVHNSTINDELEQHLVSTNHTITAEVQSHLNESDKQSNKTIPELTLNVTSMHDPNLTSTKLNASSKDTSATKVPASGFNCLNLTRGKYADKKDCRIFYTCIGNLQPMLGTCPNNTVFSEINKQCTRNLSHCVRNNQFRCLFEGRFSDFFKDNIYYICVKNRMSGFIRYKLQCQHDYHLNKDMVKCEKNEEISTQTGSSVSETINDESKPISKSEKIVSSDDFECDKEGKFPYAEDCSKYYLCTKVKNVYRRKIKKCASDEVFDKTEKKCVESDSGEC